VAEWNEVRGLFRGLNSRDARRRKDISFRNLVFGNQIERFALKTNLSARNGGAHAHRFGGHVNHLRAPIGADVRQPFHAQPPIAIILRFGW